MLLKCKFLIILISFNCSTSLVINHNNFATAIFFPSPASTATVSQDIVLCSATLFGPAWLSSAPLYRSLCVCCGEGANSPSQAVIGKRRSEGAAKREGRPIVSFYFPFIFLISVFQSSQSPQQRSQSDSS